MAYVQPGDISAILNAFGQLGQSNALIRQRKDQAAAERASTMGAIGGVAGGIAGGLASGGNPYAAMAGSAAGSQLLSGGRTSGAQTINQAGQAYQMAQGQQAHEQQQADRAAVTRAGEMLNPAPVATGPMLGDEMQGTPTQAVTQPEPNVRGAIGELFRGGQVGPAISLMAAQQKNQPDPFTLGEGQGRYDKNGNLIAERPKPEGSDDPNKTEFERNLIRVTEQAITRGDIKADDAKEFKDNLIRQRIGRTETTATGGKIDGVDVKAAVNAVKVARTNNAMSETPIKAGEKPFTPEQAAKVAMVNSAITTHAAVSKAISLPGGGYDRQMIAAMNANVPFTEGRQRRQEFRDMIEARLRAESGAAVPDSEVDRAMERFMPSILDKDPGIKSKLDRFEEWLKDTSWLIQEGRTPRPKENNDKLKKKYGLE